MNDSISITKKRIIESAKVVKKFVKSVKQLNSDQLFFERGIWSTPSECVSVGHNPNVQVCIKIKQALINLGYDLKLDNVLDANTRTAIIDFQRKNNLAEGQVDRELLDKLGIEY